MEELLVARTKTSGYLRNSTKEFLIELPLFFRVTKKVESEKPEFKQSRNLNLYNYAENIFYYERSEETGKT